MARGSVESADAGERQSGELLLIVIGQGEALVGGTVWPSPLRRSKIVKEGKEDVE